MKQALSLLMIFAFVQSQAFAIKGGPSTGGTVTSFIGTYSGVMIPNSTSVSGSSSNVGLFTFSQPGVGIAQGAAIIFVDGAAFNCNLTGLIDPDSGKLQCIVDGTSTFQVTVTIPTGVDTNGNTVFKTQDFPVFASGNIEAEVTPDFLGVALPQVVTPARINGTAQIDISFLVKNDGTPDVAKTATFDVDGFKQSETATAATSGLAITRNGSSNN